MNKLENLVELTYLQAVQESAIEREISSICDDINYASKQEGKWEITRKAKRFLGKKFVITDVLVKKSFRDSVYESLRPRYIISSWGQK